LSKLVVKTLPVCLESLDRLSVDVLVLGPFEGERPLRGTAGYCDWRLNGRLSRMLMNQSLCNGQTEARSFCASRYHREENLVFYVSWYTWTFIDHR